MKEVSLSSIEYSSVTLTDLGLNPTQKQFSIDFDKGTDDFEGIIKFCALEAVNSLDFKVLLKASDYGVLFEKAGALLVSQTTANVGDSSITKVDANTIQIGFSGTFAVGDCVAFNFNLDATSETHIFKAKTQYFNKDFIVPDESIDFDDNGSFRNYEIDFEAKKIIISFIRGENLDGPTTTFSVADHGLKITSYALSSETTSAQKNQITLTNSNGELTVANYLPTTAGEKIVIDFTL